MFLSPTSTEGFAFNHYGNISCVSFNTTVDDGLRVNKLITFRLVPQSRSITFVQDSLTIKFEDDDGGKSSMGGVIRMGLEAVLANHCS